MPNSGDERLAKLIEHIKKDDTNALFNQINKYLEESSLKNATITIALLSEKQAQLTQLKSLIDDVKENLSKNKTYQLNTQVREPIVQQLDNININKIEPRLKKFSEMISILQDIEKLTASRSEILDNPQGKNYKEIAYIVTQLEHIQNEHKVNFPNLSKQISQLIQPYHQAKSDIQTRQQEKKTKAKNKKSVASNILDNTKNDSLSETNIDIIYLDEQIFVEQVLKPESSAQLFHTASDENESFEARLKAIKTYLDIHPSPLKTNPLPTEPGAIRTIQSDKILKSIKDLVKLAKTTEELNQLELLINKINVQNLNHDFHEKRNEISQSESSSPQINLQNKHDQKSQIFTKNYKEQLSKKDTILKGVNLDINENKKLILGRVLN